MLARLQYACISDYWLSCSVWATFTLLPCLRAVATDTRRASNGLHHHAKHACCAHLAWLKRLQSGLLQLDCLPFACTTHTLCRLCHFTRKSSQCERHGLSSTLVQTHTQLHLLDQAAPLQLGKCAPLNNWVEGERASACRSPTQRPLTPINCNLKIHSTSESTGSLAGKEQVASHSWGYVVAKPR